MNYATEQPTPDDIRALIGPTVLDFGTDWCGVCRAAEAAIRTGLRAAGVPHIKVEDGRGRVLGRFFRVKLWPTLIFLHDGVEVSRLVRPTSSAQVGTAVAALLAT
ncbi:MAG: thioredoxin 1 [Myxococcota bacterium]|jgi:thioredoxin 1